MRSTSIPRNVALLTTAVLVACSGATETMTNSPRDTSITGDRHAAPATAAATATATAIPAIDAAAATTFATATFALG